MKNKVLKEPIYAERIVNAVKLSCSMEEMRNKLKDYHDNDIAQSFEFLNRAERNLLYSALDAKWLAEIISYIDNPSQYIEEIEIDQQRMKVLIEMFGRETIAELEFIQVKKTDI